VLVDRPTPELILKACRVGARGIFGRNEPADLRKCIAAVYNGEIWMGQKVVELLVSAISNPLPVQVHNANGDALLSRREQDIVRWVAEGMTNRQIAEQSGLSEHTVKNYLFRIFEKLGVSTRVELVLYSMAQRNASPGENGDNGGHDDSLSISQWLTLPEKVPLAAYVVADLFRRGYGVERDARSAYKWIWIAETIAENAQGGNGAIRQQLEQELTAREVEEAKRAAAEWLRLHWSGEPPQSSAA
jgi:DNA-binding CsgD family transcriptional regulator